MFVCWCCSYIVQKVIEMCVSCLKFQIKWDHVYLLARFATNQAIQRVVATGLGKQCETFDVLTLIEKKKMLLQNKCQFTNPCSVNLRFGYFYTCNFAIHGVSKLKKITSSKMSLNHSSGLSYI